MKKSVVTRTQTVDLAAVRGGGVPEPIPWIIYRPILDHAIADIIRIDVRPPPFPMGDVVVLP